MNAAKLTHWVVFAVTTLYTLAMYAAHVSFGTGLAAQLVSYVPTLIALGVLAFDLWIWRWPVINRIVGRPRIDGTWLGMLEPSKKSDIPLGNERGPIECALVVNQTFWSLGVTLLTEQSISHSISSAIKPAPESPNRSVLTYCYVNTPQQKYQPASFPSVGAAEFHVAGRLPKEMSGRYWTARFTAGDVDVKLVDREVDYVNLDAVVAAAKRQHAEKQAKKKAERKRVSVATAAPPTKPEAGKPEERNGDEASLKEAAIDEAAIDEENYGAAAQKK